MVERVKDDDQMQLTTADYRARIYEKYSSSFQDLGPVFDPGAAHRWSCAYDYYFRDWLPACKEVQIADLACGSGRLLFYLREKGYSDLSGVDISLEQVQLARQVSPKVIHGDLMSFLRANKESFDLITSLDIIEHFHKDEVLKFLDACFAALKPKGRLILQTPNAESPWGTALRYADFTHELSFTPQMLTKLLNLCGFVNAEARQQGPPRGYSIAATMRHLVWRLILVNMLKFYNIVETGAVGSGVFTRVFSISACKP
jgi:2-polyprenyl-3-methyl-5-hydroxy-6-metoxy-1,4-benzoquinol methylase